MKKLLSLLSVLGLTVSAGNVVVSCAGIKADSNKSGDNSDIHTGDNNDNDNNNNNNNNGSTDNGDEDDLNKNEFTYISINDIKAKTIGILDVDGLEALNEQLEVIANEIDGVAELTAQKNSANTRNADITIYLEENYLITEEQYAYTIIGALLGEEQFKVDYSEIVSKVKTIESQRTIQDYNAKLREIQINGLDQISAEIVHAGSYDVIVTFSIKSAFWLNGESYTFTVENALLKILDSTLVKKLLDEVMKPSSSLTEIQNEVNKVGEQIVGVEKLNVSYAYDYNEDTERYDISYNINVNLVPQDDWIIDGETTWTYDPLVTYTPIVDKDYASLDNKIINLFTDLLLNQPSIAKDIANLDQLSESLRTTISTTIRREFGALRVQQLSGWNTMNPTYTASSEKVGIVSWGIAHDGTYIYAFFLIGLDDKTEGLQQVKLETVF